jgi:hypothetical protein
MAQRQVKRSVQQELTSLLPKGSGSIRAGCAPVFDDPVFDGIFRRDCCEGRTTEWAEECKGGGFERYCIERDLERESYWVGLWDESEFVDDQNIVDEDEQVTTNRELVITELREGGSSDIAEEQGLLQSDEEWELLSSTSSDEWEEIGTL